LTGWKGNWTRSFLGVAAVAALSLGAGCGGDDESDKAASPGAKTGEAMKKEKGAQEKGATEKRAPAAAAKGETIAVENDPEYGEMLVDDKGQALYSFQKEKSSKSECYDDCATAWPPLLSKGEPQAGKGADAKLLGTTKRTDGKTQVTYDGKPVYHYAEDTPEKTLCHNVNEFGGLWLLVKPDGNAVS
jgi:predicted lipoprotein with Yx(FWY)xxD motif